MQTGVVFSIVISEVVEFAFARVCVSRNVHVSFRFGLDLSGAGLF